MSIGLLLCFSLLSGWYSGWATKLDTVKNIAINIEMNYSESEVTVPTLFHFHYSPVSHQHQRPDDPPCEVVVQISSDGSICWMCSGRITMIGPGVGKIDICPRLPHHPAQSLSNPISSSGPAPLSAARAEPRTLASPFVLLFLLIQLILVFPFMQIVQLRPSLLHGSTVASPLVLFSCNCYFITISTSASSSQYTDIFSYTYKYYSSVYQSVAQ